jgi:hypothetical protein
MGDCHAHTFLSSSYRCVSHTPKLKQWMTAMREDPAVSAFFLDAKSYQGFFRLYLQNSHEACDYGLWREQQSAVKLCLIFYFTDMTNNMLSFYQILLHLIGSSLICHHGLLTSQGPPTAGVHSHLTTLKHNSGGSTIVFAETPKLSSLVKSTV